MNGESSCPTIGTWGVREAITVYRDGATSTPALLAHLRERSNVAELAEVIDGPLAVNATLVRIADALDVLERALWRGVDLGRAPTGAAWRASGDPALHRLAELAALRFLDERGCRLGPEQRAEVVRVGRHHEPHEKLGFALDTPSHELRAAADDRARYWGAVVSSARTNRTDARIADTMRRSYELIGAGVD